MPVFLPFCPFAFTPFLARPKLRASGIALWRPGNGPNNRKAFRVPSHSLCRSFHFLHAMLHVTVPVFLSPGPKPV